MSAPAATASSSRLYAPSSFSSSFPYSLAQLRPYDPSSDARFYSSPRYVTHIDDAAISSLCAFYDRVLPRRPSRILDLCSSWVSHVPAEDRVIVGLGMNADELKANPALQHWVVHDLNAQPDLKDVLDTGGFDATICTVSIDYLTRPLEVMRSLAGVTIPGGRAYMAISNRCFPTKAVGPWLNLSEEERLDLVASYFHFAGTPYAGEVSKEGPAVSVAPGALWEDIRSEIVVPEGRSDPLWVMHAKRK